MTIPETDTVALPPELTNGVTEMPVVGKSDDGQEPSSAMTYKQAKYLAASERRDGVDSYAVFKPSSSQWYVKHID